MDGVFYFERLCLFIWPPLLTNDIESINISIASSSSEEYQIGQDVTNEFKILSSRKRGISGLTLEQWNKNKEYGAEQNYRDSIKLAALAFADPKSIPEGRYTFALDITLNDNTTFSLESNSVLIDPYDNGESSVKYLDVYKERDSLLCSETADVNETLNSGEIALMASGGLGGGSYLSEFILETFAIAPLVNTRCAVLSSPEPEGYCGSTSDQIVVHTIPEQYVLTAQSIGYRPIREIADNYTEGPCQPLEEEQDSE